MKEETIPKGWEHVCESLGPDDGVPLELIALRQRRRTRQRQPDHKALQYCKQAQHAIHDSLMCDCGDPYLRDLELVAVEPGPDRAVMVVTLAAPISSAPELEQVRRRLEAASGVLRSAIAGATHRKRVPSLHFRVVPQA